MKIAVISDTHDNIWKLAEAVPKLQEADAVIHCGDLCSPFVVKQLGEGLAGKPVHIVWGNNDGDQRMLAQIAGSYENITIHGELAELVMAEKKIAVNHYPRVGRALARSGDYHLVCYGHDHTAHEEIIGSSLLLNPGEIMGLNGKSTLAIYSTESGEVQ
ncbi:MAG: metallophosphoesterase [Anaerolineae bacterium]|nr:metallophosphoesterase [Anaerolineae bacterium]